MKTAKKRHTGMPKVKRNPNEVKLEFHRFDDRRGGDVDAVTLTERLVNLGYEAQHISGINKRWVITDAPEDVRKESIEICRY